MYGVGIHLCRIWWQIIDRDNSAPRPTVSSPHNSDIQRQAVFDILANTIQQEDDVLAPPSSNNKYLKQSQTRPELLLSILRANLQLDILIAIIRNEQLNNLILPQP